MSTAEKPVSSRHGYGRIARVFHWLTAMLVGAAIWLGLTMTDLPATSESEVAEIFRQYSIHKTVGIAALTVALVRIAWTLGHPGPGPLHPDRPIESYLARLVHWLLWCAILALPVSGWLHHSAAPGFAPILWPAIQSLPFIPNDEGLALILRSVHRTFGWILFAALALHILGALKHMLLDRDATLSRMVTGRGPLAEPAPHNRSAPILALAIWAVALAFGIVTAPSPEPDPFDAFETLENDATY